MSTLEQILSGSAPAQLVVVRHALGASPWALVREMLARSSERLAPILAITLLHDPTVLGDVEVQTLDLSGAVPSYSETDVEGAIMHAVSSLQPGTQILLDAADILAEDHTPAVAFRILRALLSALSKSSPSSTTNTSTTTTSLSKSPFPRLILPLPATSMFTTDLLSASLSSSLALLTPLSPRLVESTASQYLLPADDERFFPLLETASARGAGDASVLRDSMLGEEGEEKRVVQVLLRKAAGGAKGIVRSVEGLQPTQTTSGGRGGAGRWSAVPLDQVVQVQPAVVVQKATTTHADLNLPFNLSLTEQQREARGAVPLPYAHEGEGADLSMAMDWSDDEEDDEI